MLYDVYDLGTSDQPDLMAVLRVGAVRGDLRIRRRFARSSDTSMLAEVWEPGTRNILMGPLIYARAGAMNSDTWVLEGSLLIPARESLKSKVNQYQVRWLCKVPGAKAVIDPDKVARNYRSRQAVHAITGFNPNDDDSPGISYGPLDDSIG